MSSKSGKSKAFNEREHFRMRLWDRFHLTLNHREYIAACAAASAWPLAWRESTRVTVRKGEIKGVPMLVVLDSKRGRLVTVLHENEEQEQTAAVAR